MRVISRDLKSLPRAFEENALLKALYYGAHMDGFLFVDDSGIEVDALAGRPGVDSAHFDNDWLLEQLRDIENRTARFVCVIALVRLPSVTLNELAVPRTNVSTLGKLKVPVSWL